MFQSPTDVAFSLFGFPVYFYGIVLAIAILIGVYGAYLLYKIFYNRADASKIIDFSPYIIIIGIIGARLYYCCLLYTSSASTSAIRVIFLSSKEQNLTDFA